MFTRTSGPTRDREEGASAVEFAIVAPLLFMLVFGIIQFGIFFAQDLALSNGARQAARAAAVPSTGDCAAIFTEAQQGAVTIALSTVRGGASDFDMEVSTPGVGSHCTAGPFGPIPFDDTELPCSGQPAGTEVTVVVKAKGQLAIPLFGDLGEIDLEREGTYRCEFN